MVSTFVHSMSGFCQPVRRNTAPVQDKLLVSPTAASYCDNHHRVSIMSGGRGCVARVLLLTTAFLSGTAPVHCCSTGYYLINYTTCNAATGACWGHGASYTASWLGASSQGAIPVFTECCNIAYPGYYSEGGSVGHGTLLPCPGGTFGSQTGLANARCSGN